jgi:hypothetical protein
MVEEVCSFLVSPHTRGREQYLSIHLDSGPQAAGR